MSGTKPDLTIRARPRMVRRFSRKALIGGASALGVIMFGALAVALQSPNYADEKHDELYNVTHKPMAAGLELLPKSYAEIKPKLGPPLPGDLGAAYVGLTNPCFGHAKNKACKDSILRGTKTRSAAPHTCADLRTAAASSKVQPIF